MRFRLGILISFAMVCLAQTAADAPHFVEIKIPHGVDSASTFIRFVLDRDFGGWVNPKPDVSSYFVETTQKGHAAERMKAILYAPGCAMQKLDLAVSKTEGQSFSYVCNPIPWMSINGVIKPPESREMKVEVQYVARWSQKFLDLEAGIVTDIPVAKAAYRAGSGRFHLSIPDFSKDPLADFGDFQIWSDEIDSGKVIARLTPVSPDLGQNGGLKILPAYPQEIDFEMCDTPLAGPQDTFGFAVRDAHGKICNR